MERIEHIMAQFTSEERLTFIFLLSKLLDGLEKQT